MTRTLLFLFLVALLAGTVQAQETTFTPVCLGSNDTAKFTVIIATIGTNTGTIRLPYKVGTRCAVNTLTIPANVTLDNSDGTGIKINTGQTLSIAGPITNPDDKRLFYNVGSGLGITASISGYQNGYITPYWWGALGNDSNNDYPAFQAMTDFALGAPGADHGANPRANLPIYLPNGVFNLNGNTWKLINVYSARIYGASRGSTTVKSSAAYVFQTDGLWYSHISDIAFIKTSTTAGAVMDIDGNVPFTISATTNANPAVITTSSPHNIVSGRNVLLQNYSGTLGTALNGFRVATVLSPTTFSVAVNTTTSSVYAGGASEYSTRSVQQNTFTNIQATGASGTAVNTYAVAQNRQGGSSAQGENLWINPQLGSSYTAFYNNGFNALANLILRGDMQDFVTGVFTVAGHVNIIGTSFESTHPYEQATEPSDFGYDILTGLAGVNEHMIVEGIRTESLQFFKGSGTQPTQLNGVAQGVGAVTQWGAFSGYSLHQVLLKNVTVLGISQPHAFFVSTVGTSGAVEPTWPATGTVADGSIVWTEMPFRSVNATVAGIVNCDFAGPVVVNRWLSSDIVIGSTLSANQTLTATNAQWPRITYPGDATGGSFSTTLNQAPNIYPIGQTFKFKRVDATANTWSIAGGAATIDGAAFVNILPNGWLEIQYTDNNVYKITGSSNALTLNGATFASPGTIGGTTPGAITGTTITANTSLTINGGTAVTKILSATASLNFTALAANSCEILTITVTGAADGDTVTLGVPTALADVDGATERTVFYGWVSGADTVSVRRCNVTGTITVDPAAATVRAAVIKF